MTRASADRVKAVWTGTGTGTMILGGAAPGEPVQAFPAALNGQVVRYLIKHETAQEAEAGIGIYTHSGTTLSRIYRTYPLPGGAAVSFSSGNKFVSVTNSHLDLVVNVDTTDPSTDDNISTGFLQGHLWVNETDETAWILINHDTEATLWVRVDGAGVSLEEGALYGRLAPGSGNGVGFLPDDLAEEPSPEAGHFFLGWVQAGSPATWSLRKIDIGNLPSVADAPPSLVPSDAATFVLTPAMRLTDNVIVTSHQANVVFQVPSNATANTEWRVMPRHDGCTATVVGGTITPSPARLTTNGIVIISVVSNAGSAPVVQVRGEVITPSTLVTTKTYDLDDNGQNFTASGTQTFSMAAATIPSGYHVNIWNTSAGVITIDGLDADHSVPANGVVTVFRRDDGALVCNGNSVTGLPTVLDAA